MKVSAIVPTLNEEENLGPLLEELHCQGAETVVADGRSSDQTVDLARNLGATVVEVPANRGRQLNAGAEAATGDIFFFVHADVIIPPNAVADISRTLESDRFVGGAFSLKFHSNRPSIKLIQAVTNWRSRRLLLPYGDQGIFCTRAVFNELGGYRDYPIMEDMDYVMRLNRISPVVILPSPIIVSARRLEKEGVFYNTIRNWILAGLFILGFSPYILKKHYPHIR